MTSMPPPPVPPPPFFPRVRLPDIGAQRASPGITAEEKRYDDPLLGGPSRMQQRRMEIEEELRRGFDLPDPLFKPDRSPPVGRPPPVPKPPGFRDKASPTLPPLNGAKRNDASSAAHDPCNRPQSWRKPSHWRHHTPSESDDGADVHPEPPSQFYADSPNAPKPKVSLRGVHEAKQQQRREEKRREEHRRQRQAEEEARRQQDEQDWEADIRQRFKQERARMDAQQRHRNPDVEAGTRRAEAEARQAEAQARRAEDAAAEAKSQAEKVRRRMAEQAAKAKEASPQSPYGEKSDDDEHRYDCGYGRHRRRHGKRHAHADGARSTPRPAAYVHRDLSKSQSLSGSRKVVLPQEEVLRQAETAALQQLAALRLLPSKKEQQKAYKELLRAWHPDKNPQNLEVATAVFQRLQSERGRALGGA